jgi:hypothetical protein
MHLEKLTAASDGRLALLPKTRGFRGLSRPVAWAMARRNGLDPKVWVWRGGRWTTHGGGAFNSLLAAVLSHRFAPDVWRADDLGVEGPDPGAIRLPPLSLTELVEATTSAVAEPRTLSALAAKFVQPSRYRNKLSIELRAIEARASLPVAAFLRWIGDCRLEVVNGQ